MVRGCAGARRVRWIWLQVRDWERERTLAHPILRGILGARGFAGCASGCARMCRGCATCLFVRPSTEVDSACQLSGRPFIRSHSMSLGSFLNVTLKTQPGNPAHPTAHPRAPAHPPAHAGSRTYFPPTQSRTRSRTQKGALDFGGCAIVCVPTPSRTRF